MHRVIHAKQRTSSHTAHRAALERVREKAAVCYCKGAPSSVTGTWIEPWMLLHLAEQWMSRPSRGLKVHSDGTQQTVKTLSQDWDVKPSPVTHAITWNQESGLCRMCTHGVLVICHLVKFPEGEGSIFLSHRLYFRLRHIKAKSVCCRLIQNKPVLISLRQFFKKLSTVVSV